VYRFDNPERAATWMDWGWWIAALFRFELTAIIGQYDGQDDFFRKTAAMVPHRARIDREVRNFVGRWDLTPRTCTMNGVLTLNIRYGSPFELLDDFHPMRDLDVGRGVRRGERGVRRLIRNTSQAPVRPSLGQILLAAHAAEVNLTIAAALPNQSLRRDGNLGVVDRRDVASLRRLQAAE
jgi:hypothetical protein